MVECVARCVEAGCVEVACRVPVAWHSLMKPYVNEEDRFPLMGTFEWNTLTRAFQMEDFPMKAFERRLLI